jgi:hypothetical protein
MKTIQLLLLFLLPFTSFTQTPLADLVFAEEIYGARIGGKDIEIDEANNLILFCIYTKDEGDTIAYQGEILVAPNDPLKGFLLIKLSPDGELLFTQHAGVDAIHKIQGLETDSENNILLYLESWEAFEWNGTSLSPGTHLLKLNAEGEYIWHREISGIYHPWMEESIAINCQDQVTLAGTIGLVQTDSIIGIDTIIFYPDTFPIYLYVSDTLTIGNEAFPAPGDNAIYVTQLQADGSVNWVRQFSQNAGIPIQGLHTHPYTGNVLISGRISEDSLWLGSEWLTIDPNLGTHIYLIELDHTGQLNWARAYPSDILPYDLCYNPDGSFYLSGMYYLETTFEDTTIISLGVQDIALLHFDEEGNFDWAQTVGTEKTNQQSHLTTSSEGDVVVSGFAINKGNPIERYAASSSNIWKLKDEGNGNLNSGQTAFDTKGNLYVVGTYSGMTVFGTDTLSIWGGDVHEFILKFKDQDAPPNEECQITVNVEETRMVTQLQVYPNPTSGILTIEGWHPEKAVDIHLIDQTGRILQQTSTQNPVLQLDVSPYPSGIYWLIVRSDSEQWVEKVVTFK